MLLEAARRRRRILRRRILLFAAKILEILFQICNGGIQIFFPQGFDDSGVVFHIGKRKGFVGFAPVDLRVSPVQQHHGIGELFAGVGISSRRNQSHMEIPVVDPVGDNVICMLAAERCQMLQFSEIILRHMGEARLDHAAFQDQPILLNILDVL